MANPTRKLYTRLKKFVPSTFDEHLVCLGFAGGFLGISGYFSPEISTWLKIIGFMLLMITSTEGLPIPRQLAELLGVGLLVFAMCIGEPFIAALGLVLGISAIWVGKELYPSASSDTPLSGQAPNRCLVADSLPIIQVNTAPAIKRAIYQYVLDTVTTLEMPQGAEIMSVREQGGVACLWALVDPDAPLEPRRFRTYSTGDSVSERKLTFRGTLFVQRLCRGEVATEVLHVFELGAEDHL